MWGWEPRELTEYHYDGAGRLIGSTKHRESEFDARQRDLLLAHLRSRRDIGPHGQPMSEATDPRANPSVEGGWHYEAAPVTEFAQLAINTARDRYLEQYGKHMTDAQKAALHWTVRRVDDP